MEKKFSYRVEIEPWNVPMGTGTGRSASAAIVFKNVHLEPHFGNYIIFTPFYEGVTADGKPFHREGKHFNMEMGRQYMIPLSSCTPLLKEDKVVLIVPEKEWYNKA